MPERPLLIPLGSLIAGLCAADALGSSPPAWALAALLATTLAACLVPARLPFLLSLSLLFFVLGACSLEPFLNPSGGILPYLTEQPVPVEGVVDQRPEGTVSGGGRLYLQIARVGERAAAGRVLVQIGEGRASFCTGDRILFVSRIRRPRALGIPGESDYPRRLAYQGVFATCFVKTPADLLLVRAGSGWRHGIDRLADALGRFISRESPGVEGGVLKALLLGDSGEVPESLNDLYARSGVNHILSISGFHVGIIFLCVFQFFFLLARRCEMLALRLNLRKALLLASLPVVVFYLFLSGAAPATVRSVLMIVAFIAALHLRREVEPVNSVMLAACAILFCAPETLFDVSFELSFLAIWGLVVLAPYLSAPVSSAPLSGAARAARWFLLLMAASAAAILATLVPVAYYFHRVSFIGLLANLAIVPLMGYGAVVAGFASLPLSFVAPLPAGLLLRLAAWLVKLSDQVIFFLAKAPVFTGYAPTGVDILVACLVLSAVTFVRPKVWRLLLTTSLLLVLIVRAVPAGGVDGRLRIDFLSVGQGDSALVRLPDGKTMLVDGGGRAGADEDRAGKRLLLPALWRLGVGRIDYLVLSHEHPDHLQGVLYLAGHFDVGELWESGVPGVSREYLELNWLAAVRGIPVRTVNAALPPFTVGAVAVDPLWPDPRLPAAYDANDSSLVFRLRHGKSSVLFTGDLGAAAEDELLARGAPLRSSVLKVGHHGSRYSSSDAFLAAVSPKAAVISAGYRNTFHLPAPSTLLRLQRHGIPLYRTDLDGTVEAVCGADGEVIFNISAGHFN